MKSHAKTMAFIAIILTLSLLTPLSYADDKIKLPKIIGDWEISDDVQIYEGDDLYLYINGGAELYHEYGFLNVTATDYTSGEDSIAVEVYRLKNSAFGLYSLLRDEAGKTIATGQEGSLSDYYLLFWQGNDMVAITAHSEKGNDPAILTQFARELAPVLSANAEIPDFIKILPENGLKRGSVKYLQGSIGLLNNYPNLAKYFFKFSQGAAGSYDDGSSLLVLSWKTEAEAKAAMNKAIKLSKKEDNKNDSIVMKGDELILTFARVKLKAKLKHTSIYFKK